MKKIIFSLFEWIGRFFSFICPRRIAQVFSRIYYKLYTGYMKGAFGEFYGDLLGKIVVVGAERMYVDKGVKLYGGVTLHTIEAQSRGSELPPPEMENNHR